MRNSRHWTFLYTQHLCRTHPTQVQKDCLTTFLMELKKDVVAELKWEPSVNEAEVGVMVKDGLVTLTGTVARWPEKLSAERAAQRVSGVRAVANEIQVELPGGGQRPRVGYLRAA